MKRITFLMTGLLVLMLACDNPVNVPENAPDVFRELTDLDLRVDESDINVHVTMSFKFPFKIPGSEGDMEYVLRVIENDEVPNFPGNEKNAGTCVDGAWKNKNGKLTSGSMDKPHPHCVVYELVGGEETEVEVELEPISAHYHDQGGWNLRFTNQSGNKDMINLNFNSGKISGHGSIKAWAVLHSDNSRRVGTITIDLTQFKDFPVNEEGCTVLGTTESDECINQFVAFSYEPLPVDEGGIGEAMDFPNDETSTTGFLWWYKADDWFRDN